MAKVNIKSEKITPFGGIYFASKAFYALSLDKVINGALGVRSSTYNGYQWDEVVSAMSDVFLCGGDCVEDVNRSECHLRESPEVRIPTSHTIGRAIKELSHEDMECKSSSGNVFRFNTNPRLNDLLMKLNMKMGLFKSGRLSTWKFPSFWNRLYLLEIGIFPIVLSIRLIDFSIFSFASFKFPRLFNIETLMLYRKNHQHSNVLYSEKEFRFC